MSDRRGGSKAGGDKRGGGDSGSGRSGSGRSGSGRSGSGKYGSGPAAARQHQPNRKPSAPQRSRPRADNTARGPAPDVHQPDGVRLQKVLAGAGWGSRRACEQLISAGRVQVDDVIVRELGVRVDPRSQVIHVDGTRVVLDDTLVYLAFNKPLGVVSTMSDELGRPCLGDYVGNRSERLFHVGRLDADTEGLLLLTNDGDLSHRLQHPSYEVPKTYVAQVPGPVARDVGRRLREGLELEDGHVKVDSFRIIDSLPGKAIVEVILHEGKKHVVRRMLGGVGHPVIALTRVQVGPIRLGETKPGRWRALTREEVGSLHRAAQM
ncbi:MAG: pseudouridine synthase [Ornithinimicrobium sp.]